MRGKKSFTPKVFYTFSLEAQVPPDHLLRRLAAVLDLRFVEQRTRGLYGINGHVSVDPVVIVKMLLLGYLYNVASVRELMRQIEDRLSFRWFLGYDIDEPIPDHSVISKAVKRFGPALFEELFTRTVQQCAEAGLIGGELAHVDATLIHANASGDSIQPVERFTPRRTAPEYVQDVERETPNDDPPDDKPPPAGGAGVNEAFQSTTDPDAAIISRDGGKRMLAYKDHRVVDDQCGVILATHATSARVAEGTQLPALIRSVIQRGHSPRAVAGDKGYGYASNFRLLWEHHITAHLARSRSPRQKPGVFGKEEFTYLTDADVYVCPAGERLSAGSRQARRGFREYKASPRSCAECAIKAACLSGTTARTIQRHHDEGYLSRIRPGPISRRFALRRRKAVIEGSFADAKERRAHRKAQRRGLEKMQLQCHLVAAVQNLVKLAKSTAKKAQTAAQRLRVNPVHRGQLRPVHIPNSLDRVNHA